MPRYEQGNHFGNWYFESVKLLHGSSRLRALTYNGCNNHMMSGWLLQAPAIT